jgi:tetratricopeptide (TPR) repeat protein
VEALLAEGTRVKEEGNDLFKAAKYREALACYKRVLLSTRRLASLTADMAPFSTSAAVTGAHPRGAPLTDEQDAAYRALLLSIYSNLGATYVKLADADKAVVYCSKGLELDPRNAKLMLRLGQAYHLAGALAA